MTKITTYNRGIIIDGHADTKEECETITLLCDSLAKDKNFKQVAYDYGYAAFEKIGKAERLRFAIIPQNGLTVNFDTGIESVDFSYGSNTHTFTTSEELYGFTTEPGSDITLTINLKSGYSLKSSSLGSVSGNIVTIPFDAEATPTSITCTLVSEAASTTVTLEAGVYKISKTPNLINNSKAGTSEDIMTDGTVFIKDTVIYNGTEIECDSKGIMITWGGTKSSGASANASFMIVNATPNDYIWRISEASDGSSYQYRFANLTAPTDEQFDKVLTITLTSGVEISQSLYDWWTANTTKQSSQVSVDLTTLSGWQNLSSGSHTIKIVAKGTGYRDSEKSVGVSVTKPSSGYTVTITYGGLEPNVCFYSLDNGLTWIDGYVAGQSKLVLNNVKQIKFKAEDDGHSYAGIYSTLLNVSLHSGYNDGPKYSENFTLTQDVNDVEFTSGAD